MKLAVRNLGIWSIVDDALAFPDHTRPVPPQHTMNDLVPLVAKALGANAGLAEELASAPGEQRIALHCALEVVEFVREASGVLLGKVGELLLVERD